MPGWLQAILIAVAVVVGSWLVLIVLARRLPPGVAKDLAGFLPDCVAAARTLRRDPRVPRRARIAVLIAALAGFAVTIMPVKRPAIWFWGIFIGTVLPLQTFLSPQFTGYAKTGLYDTQYGMMLVYVALAVPFAFFVNRNFMMTVPKEITEAAQLDGANWLRMFFRVHLPLAKSALLAAFIWVGANQSLTAATINSLLPTLRVADLVRPTLQVPAHLPVAEALRRTWESRMGSI